MENNHNGQPTLQDVLDAVNESSTAIESRLQKVENRLDKLDTDVAAIKATMVTKDYLDVKLSDLKGDMVLMMRKEDTKLKELVSILHQKKVITEADAKHILGMDPFPQLAL